MPGLAVLQRAWPRPRWMMTKTGRRTFRPHTSPCTTWRAKRWLEVAAQGIGDEEVQCHDLLTPLMSGAEGTTKALAKCLVAAWRWNIKVRGKGVCPPAPTMFNIGRFLHDQVTEEGWGELHWFVAYPCTLQRGSSWKEMECMAIVAGDQSLPASACLLAQN